MSDHDPLIEALASILNDAAKLVFLAGAFAAWAVFLAGMC